MITNAERDRIRGLCNRLGTDKAAEALGIHKTSLLLLLSGIEDGIRPNTEKVVRAALDSGVTDTVTRGETSAKSDRTKRGAR